MKKNISKNQDLNIEWLINEYPILKQIKEDITKNKKLYNIFSSFDIYINLLEKKMKMQKIYFDNSYNSFSIEKKNILRTDMGSKKYNNLLKQKAEVVKERIYNLKPKF
jgi:hypothetical protein